MLSTIALLLPLLSALPQDTGRPAPAPVVVELFTSEGCSSCPPAEKLLNELSAREDVIALSFHVDYWNSLGWRDRFSSKAFSERQRAYVGKLRESSGYAGIYTPQIVVAGQVGFVGHDRRQAQTAILRGKVGQTRTLTLQAERKGEQLNVRYRYPGPLEGRQLQLAVVEDGLVTRVPRGENKGRTLSHDAVVRAWKSQPAQAEAAVALALPPDIKPENTRVVAFVQHANGKIELAKEIDLPVTQEAGQAGK